jgi:predicted RNase H-like nuclease
MGIDLAWHSDKNPTALACGDLVGGELRLYSIDIAVLPVDKIVERVISMEGLKGVAIDASLVIPNATGQRRCESELSQYYGAMGVSCHASNTTLYPEASSVTLSRRLEIKGYQHLGRSKWQIECYPHPAMIEIFGLSRRLAYKKGRVAEKRAGQKHLASLIRCLSCSPVLPLHLETHVQNHLEESYIDTLRGRELKSNEDALDSVICLYIAALYAMKKLGHIFGNLTDGYIWVPKGSMLPQ